MEMAIAVIPAALVQQIQYVIALADWRIFAMRFERLACQRNYLAIGGGDHFGHRLRAADVQPVMVINLLSKRTLAAVYVSRLVSHLRMRGEPALPHRIANRTGRHPRRSGGP